ncbi:uncharacterized mitochondrial protein AtMg00240-like [Henckelia pumila]|uniref:uncharacterized mitochondrial protein AtMg00240-like n=1 Tax=Henckelia pumila TaxID=405737 RepID=UPI003C6E81EE
MGNLKYFLGLEIARSSTGIFLSQRHYTLTLLEDTGFLASKQATVPMKPRVRLTNNGDLLQDMTQYRQLIGRLLYLTISRPDIIFVVHKLSQYVSRPRTFHLTAVHHLLKYLKSSLGQDVFFPTNSSCRLRAFSDADWAACIDTRKSVTGFYILLGML